ncbi:hypothetical protein [Dietzia kunjamensis]|nr:hypothetical protein [Dietzia kunjamensis]
MSPSNPGRCIGGHDARLEMLELLEDPENMISDIEVATGWEAV